MSGRGRRWHDAVRCRQLPGETAGGKVVTTMKKITIRKTGSIKLTTSVAGYNFNVPLDC
jgi:hypothetical protein